MLDSIAIIGKSTSGNPLDALVNKTYVNDVFVIEFNSKSNDISVNLEQCDSDESKYLYKRAKEGKRPGKFFTCIVRKKDLGKLKKNVEIDIFKWKYITKKELYESHLDLQHTLISKDCKVPQKNIDLLHCFRQEIILKQDLIIDKLRNIILQGNYGDSMLTYKIDDKYLGEIEGFPWLLQQVSQGDKSQVSDTLRCTICGNFAVIKRLKEQLPFFSIDKKTFIPDGDKTNSAKALPLCSTCYDDLKKGIKYITDRENQIDYNVPYIYLKEGEIYQRSGKLRFWLIPQLNDLTDFSLVQDYLRRPEKGLSSFRSLFDLASDMENVQKLRTQMSDKTVHEEKDKIMSLLTFTVLFYMYDEHGHMKLIEAADSVYPGRLEELAHCKREVDMIAKKTGNNKIRFYFGLLMDFLQLEPEDPDRQGQNGNTRKQKEKNPGWMKTMSYIMASLFTNKQVDETLISKILLSKAQYFISKRKLEQWYEIMLKATLTLEYLYRIRALSLPRVSDSNVSNSQVLKNDSMARDAHLFLTSHSGILRNNHSRGICAIGIMAGILIKAQMKYLDSDSAPFVSQLNRLEMDVDRLISMPRRVWPRLKYYDAEKFDTLFTYLLDSEIANINLDSPDLNKKEMMNLIFTIGMAHGFTIFENSNLDEEQVKNE